VVLVTGTARPEAIVIAENVSRHFSDGRRYSAQAYATQPAAAGTGGAGWPYQVYLGPVPDTAGGVVVSQPGDTISIYQLVRNAENNFEMSDSTQIAVP
jgi:hypothetical protein